MSQLIAADSSVLFHFSIKLEDGSVADSTALHGKPARLRMGDGSLTPSFEQCLLGLREGESKSFTLAPEEAFGLQSRQHLPSRSRQVR
jgi:FKBP-type peptidyl-prolyl cis-trans isomerase SlpA